MVSWAPTARAETARAPAVRRRAVPRAARQRTFGGVIWIVVAGVLLSGVVAVNVAVLQLNVRLNELGGERIRLRDDNARLSSQLSSASAAARIESLARNRLGLVPADPSTTSYLDLAPPAK
jgi:cell division protein FtsL